MWLAHAGIFLAYRFVLAYQSAIPHSGNISHLISVDLLAQRVNKCFEDACHGGNTTSNCTKFISCYHGYEKRFTPMPDWNDWKNNENASVCFMKDSFDFGIFEAAVNLTTHRDIFDRYLYSLFWGFQLT